jgi:tripartite-type tricarboxylate transporter receptor subunit TctC
MVVNPSVPVKTVSEFISYAKANPGKIHMASAGPGSGSHLYGELFKVMADVDLVTVHFRGAGPALPELISGRIQVGFNPVVSTIGYIRAGQLRPLGVTTATRINVLPDLPPIGDFVPGYEASGWIGIGAPAHTPPQIIEILNREANAALADPSFKAKLVDLGVEPFATSPAEFGKFIIEFTEKWDKVIRAAGIKLE